MKRCKNKNNLQNVGYFFFLYRYFLTSSVEIKNAHSPSLLIHLLILHHETISYVYIVNA